MSTNHMVKSFCRWNIDFEKVHLVNAAYVNDQASNSFLESTGTMTIKSVVCCSMKPPEF